MTRSRASGKQTVLKAVHTCWQAVDQRVMSAAKCLLETSGVQLGRTHCQADTKVARLLYKRDSSSAVQCCMETVCRFISRGTSVVLHRDCQRTSTRTRHGDPASCAPSRQRSKAHALISPSVRHVTAAPLKIKDALIFACRGSYFRSYVGIKANA